jgi:hypothetical protein
MKTFLLALLAFHTGCAAVASEGPSPTAPASASQNAPASAELARSTEAAANPEEPPFAVPGGYRWSRVASLPSGGHAVVLRQRDSLLVGTLDAQGRPIGELATIPARHVIGAPSVAANHDVAIVAWAQGETTGCTSLMATTFTPGEAPGPVQRIPGTECTEERSARAPVLKQSGDGRFVLAFTEIGVWSTQAVAMMVDARKQNGEAGLEATAMR